MTDWKQMVEQSLREFELHENSEGEVTFGEPATDLQLEEVEQALEVKLPVQLREALAAFNGAQSPLGEWVIFDVQTMIEVNKNTREDYADWDLTTPVDNAVAFSDEYGTGDLCAICVKAFDDFLPGEVVLFLHETGEYTRDFKEYSPDLKSYLQRRGGH